MNVLVIGSGGREHALAWKLAQSPRVSHVFVAPGNGGTERGGDRDPALRSSISNIPLAANNFIELISFARRESVELTIVGPEAPLAEGIVDAFQVAGLRCFGPTRAATQLEASKAFAKDFMARHGIPTARYAAFHEYEQALAHLRRVEYPVVVKASGLAGGKGVIVPASREEAEVALHQIMVERVFGAAGDEVVIEERLWGQEASVLAFCDGSRVVPMPAAQDHKPVFDGDQGPNTGGMGAYAPAPLITPALMDKIVRTILQPTVDGLRAEGIPYVGVLYAGLMITDVGPEVLEFNCRFGDPEAQVILPLLETDLVDVVEACLDGALDRVTICWRPGAAATVVAASEGYPGSYPKGREITGVEEAAALPGVIVFHAGTRRTDDGRLLTDGGRVLNVTGLGDNLAQAIAHAYEGIRRIRFQGMHYRRDIGAKALVGWQPPAIRNSVTYRDAGVDLEAGHRAVELMQEAVRATYGPEVLWGIGAFGGLFDASALKQMASPVLVASTDGVGTKTKIAAALGRFDTIGYDVVNHCVNDILVQGARPLFFLDYIASGKLDPEMVAAIVRGCAAACRTAGCALLGGETAEMPGVYAPGEFDLVGTIVGVVDRPNIVDGRTIVVGDVIIGLASSGLHTNGYSLARHVFEGWDLAAVVAELGRPLGEALLEPHRSYLAEVCRLWDAGIAIKGMAHITGGGLIDNPPRILPMGVAARLRWGSWIVPPIFQLIQRVGQVSREEMARVFNLGLGMLLIVSVDQADRVLELLGDGTWIVGEIIPRGEGPAVRIE
jgi:phosphoribosylamine--glycine ligase/phosphoribosylaminoimidazole synthetase